MNILKREQLSRYQIARHGHHYNGKNSDKSCSQKNWITSSLRSMIDWVICIIKGPNSQYNYIVADDVFIEKISKRLQRGQR